MKDTATLMLVLMVIGLIGTGTVGCNRTEAVSANQAPSPPVSEAKAPAAQSDVSVDQAKPAEEIVASSPALERVAEAAMKKASDANRHLFMFISSSDNEETATAKRTFETAVSQLGVTADSVCINRLSATDKGFIDKFQLSGAPMPIVLALAPNGAVTGAFFGEKLKNPQLKDSIVSAPEQQVLKALQDRKLVLLCAQNGATTSNDAAMQGVNDFKTDARFAATTEVVKVDPTAAEAQGFLAKLKLDPKMAEATTALLAPPGALVKTVTGATTKDALVSALQAASSGGCCAGGGGSKGCCPKK